MKRMKLALWATFWMLVVNPLLGFGASSEPFSQRHEQDRQKPDTPTEIQLTPREKTPRLGTGMPLYVPPLRGAPSGRVGGGTRGSGGENACLQVLAPDHVGLTTQGEPSLYWHLTAPVAYAVEFTLIENRAPKPLLERKLDVSSPFALQCFRLSDHGVSLQPHVLYRWFVALIPDPERRSEDILSGGFIRRIDPPEGFRERVNQSERTEQVRIYAEAGFWYDALMTVSSLIDTSPDDAHLRRMRASLLEQVGLHPAAGDLK